MIIKKLFDSGSDKLQEPSKEYSHLLIEGAEIKEIQVFIVVIMSFIVIRSSIESGSGSRAHVISSTGISSDGIRVSCSWSATSSSESRISSIGESVEIMDQVMLQCVSVIELSFMEKKASNVFWGNEGCPFMVFAGFGCSLKICWLRFWFDWRSLVATLWVPGCTRMLEYTFPHAPKRWNLQHIEFPAAWTWETRAFGTHDWTCHTTPLWLVSRPCFDGACPCVVGRT